MMLADKDMQIIMESQNETHSLSKNRKMDPKNAGLPPHPKRSLDE